MAENNSGLIDMPDLDTNPTCYNLYQEFYSGILSSQDGRSDISLETRIMNASYMLASPIARAIGTGGGGGGGGGGEELKGIFVQKSGDAMSGNLDMLYGFKGGTGGLSYIEMANVKDENGVVTDSFLSIPRKMKIDSTNLYINDKILFNLYTDLLSGGETLKIDVGAWIESPTAGLKLGGALSVLGGEDNGLYVSDEKFIYKTKNVWHGGNSNSVEYDWSMKDASVAGNLTVSGNTTVTGVLSGLGGVSLGYNGSEVFVIQSDQAELKGSLFVYKDYAIKFNNIKTIWCPSDFNIQVGSIGGDLFLGGETTNVIRLFNTLTTEAGDHKLIDQFGNAEFMNTVKIGYEYGDVLMSTCTGSVLVHQKLRFNNEQGTYLQYKSSGLEMGAKYSYNNTIKTHTSSFTIGKSTSHYASLIEDSESVFVDSSCDFFTYNKPIEAKSFIGISEKATRLTENSLFFNDNVNLVALEDGIKHYGKAYFNDNLSSVRFSTGFAGYGWAIRNRTDNGNVELTVDEAVIRKKLRSYELEIQKVSVVNGSLWVSDSCKGDLVEIIE